MAIICGKSTIFIDILSLISYILFMPATFEEKKTELRHKGEAFLKTINVSDKEGALNSLLDLFNGSQIDIRDLHRDKVDKSDIRELIIEMREGFKRMDVRFEAVDKRFESVDKRFESVDKRFEDMQRYMDRRFEDMNKRFNSMQWMIGFGFTIMVIITTVYKFVN